MRAVGYQSSLPIEDPGSLVDIDLPQPSPLGRDLLVRIEAVSVNPVDTEIRRRVAPEPGTWKVLGWDAAGTVVDAGADATSAVDVLVRRRGGPGSSFRSLPVRRGVAPDHHPGRGDHARPLHAGI